MKRISLLYLCFVGAMLGSCGKSGENQNEKAGSVATPTPEEFLKKASDAMLATKTAKFGLKRLGKPAIFNEELKLTFTDASCEYQAPDRAHATIKVGLANGNQMQIERMWVPEGIYQTNPLTKQYAKAPPDVTFNVVILFKEDGIPKVLHEGVKNPKVIGNEKVDDEPAVHFKGEADGKLVAPLLANMIPADKTYPVDVYTDPKTYYPKRIVMDVGDGDGFQIDLYGVGSPLDLKSPAVAAVPAPPAKPAPEQAK